MAGSVPPIYGRYLCKAINTCISKPHTNYEYFTLGVWLGSHAPNDFQGLPRNPRETPRNPGRL
eukprot:8611826-Pyramimonas_sp.AAC.1